MREGFMPGLAELVMLTSVCSAAYGYIVLERLAGEVQSVFLSSGLMMFVGGFGSLLTVLIYQGVQPLYAAANNQTLWLVMVCIVVLENVIGLTVQTWLIRRYSATFLAISSFITPLCSILIGIWFLGEPWYHSHGAALGCILSGVVLFYQEEIRQSIAERMQQIG
jgi:drug/metabolite transporter (DMT)-like permease